MHNLCAVLRLAQGRFADPSAVALNARTLQSTPESEHRASYEGAERRRGLEVHAAEAERLHHIK